MLPIVLRIRTSPADVEDLRAARAQASARRALEELSGLLFIELDGVELTGGRAEGPLLPTLEALLGAVAGLQRGTAPHLVPLGDGGLLLLLRPRGTKVLLTLVELGPPARLPVRELSVELAALTEAALGAAAELCRALAGSAPGALAERRLRGASRPRRSPLAGRREDQPPAAQPHAEGPAASGRPALDAGQVHCETWLDEADGPVLRAETAEPGLAELLTPGRLQLRAGGASLTVEGFPFLILRDLALGLQEVAGAQRRGETGAGFQLGRPGRAPPALLRFDLAAGALALAGASGPATPRALAVAVRRAVESFTARALAEAPAHGSNPSLLELRAAAAEALTQLEELVLGDAQLAEAPPPARTAPPAPSQRPLGPGALRRVLLRPGWRDHVGAPVGRGLARAGGVTLALGEEAMIGRSPARAWRAPGGDWAALGGGLLLVRRGDRLAALEPASGRERWCVRLAEAYPTGAAGPGGGPLLLAEAGALSALDPASGSVRWRLDLPGGHGMALSAFGPLLVAGTGSGLLYAVDLGGRMAWRVRAPGPALAAPLLAGGAIASLHAAGPQAVLLLVDPATGRRRLEVPLDVRPGGAPVRFAGGVAVGGRSGGAAVVVLVDPVRGRRWEVEAPLEGAPRLVAAGRALLAADSDGALAALGPEGRVEWSLPAAGASGGASPAAAQGVVAAAREGVALLDLGSGRPLGGARGLAPCRLLAGPGLTLVALEADGTVTGLATTGHLGVI